MIKIFALLIITLVITTDCQAQTGVQYEALANDYHWAKNIIDKRCDDAIIHANVGAIAEITAGVNYSKYVPSKCKAPSKQRRWSTAQTEACKSKILKLIGEKLAANYPFASSSDVGILCDENPVGCDLNVKYETWFRESHNRNIERLRNSQIEALNEWSSQKNAQIQAGILEDQAVRRQQIAVALQNVGKNIQHAFKRAPGSER